MLIYFLCLQYKMSGFGTKKPGADGGVQLTFPAVYQEVYASEGVPLSYWPGLPYAEPSIMIGDDFQSQVHQQRKADADAMAMARVQSRHNMNVRSQTGHAGYHLPKPLLGQRRFANPAMGAYSAYSARQDYRDAPFNFEGSGYEGSGLVGGVLRTAEGQAFGKARLLDRIRQLNNIAQAKTAFQLAGAPGAVAGLPTQPGATPAEVSAQQPTPGVPQTADIGEIAKTELNQLLASVNDQLTTNADGTFRGVKTTYTDSTRALALIVRMATTGGAEDIQNILDFINDGDGIIAKIQALLDPDADLENRDPSSYAQLSTMLEYWTKVRGYLNDMLQPDIMNRPIKERQEASKIYLKKHQISNAFRISPAPADLPDSGTIVSSRGRTSVSGWSGTPSDDFFPPDGRGRPPRREDEEHGYSRSFAPDDFTADERQSFGYASGAFFPTGGRSTGYFQEPEDAVDYGAPGREPAPTEATPSEDSFGFLGGLELGSTLPKRGEANPFALEQRLQEIKTPSVRSEALPLSGRTLDEATGEHNVVVPSAPRASASTASTTPSERARRGKAERKSRREGKPVYLHQLAGRPAGMNLAEASKKYKSGSLESATSSQVARFKAKQAEAKAKAKPAPPPPAPEVPAWLPKSKAELPTTREGYIALSNKIAQYKREHGRAPTNNGENIYIYDGSKLANVRKNFIARLKL